MFGGVSFESESESIEKLRASASTMSEGELIRQGKMLRDLCNCDKPPDAWVQKLRILRDEYRRRHPKLAG